MTIKYIPQNKKEIEVEGYGKFTVRKYGVNEEFQIESDMREMETLFKKAKNFAEKYKGKKDEEIPEDVREEMKTTQARLDELNLEMTNILKGTIASETPGAVDKLFSELDRGEIRRIINTAIRGSAVGEK